MKLLLIICAGCFISCAKEKNTTHFTDWQANDMNNNTITGEDITSHTVNIVVLVSPDCPLSQKYTKTLLAIQQEFSGMDIYFTGVVPGNYKPEEVTRFQTDYAIDFPVVIDKTNGLINALKGTITPEVFVLDKNGKTVYFGAVDNGAVDLGQKRHVITEHYLTDAINAVLNGEEVKVKQTKAIGCFIEPVKTSQ